jgi:hypothetical protein
MTMMDEVSKKKRLPKKLLFITGILLLLVAIGLGIFYEFIVSHDPIPKSIISEVNFTLYYPTALPQSWKLDKSTIYADPSDKVVGYVLRGPNGNLNISIQPVPSSFDFNSFYTKRLSNTVQFLTPLGQGAIGEPLGANQLVGSLVTTSSWVLGSPSSNKVTQSDIQFVLSHLKTASP